MKRRPQIDYFCLFSFATRKKEFISKEVAQFLSMLKQKITDRNIPIVCGSGHRQTQIVKDYHSLEKMLLKTLQDEEIEAICGTERNSYYKTDNDAAAMCLKADYYSGLGSNMHAVYSLQIAVSKGLILDYLVSQDRSDSKTFIPLLDNYHADYGSFSEKLWQTADMVHWITAGIWLLRA